MTGRSLAGSAQPGCVIITWLPEMPRAVRPRVYDNWDIAVSDIQSSLSEPDDQLGWSTGTLPAWDDARALHLTISGAPVPVLLVEVPVRTAPIPASAPAPDFANADTETLSSV